MSLKLTQQDEVPRRGLWSSTVAEFVATGYDVAEVDLDGRDALEAARALDWAIRYEMLSNVVKRKKRGGRVFLVRVPAVAGLVDAGASRSQS